MPYTNKTKFSPTITGAGIADITGENKGMIIGTSLNWQAQLSTQATLDGNVQIPDIIKGQAAVQVLLPEGTTTQLATITFHAIGHGTDVTTSRTYFNHPTALALSINGARYTNTYYTGGGVATQDLGEGMKSLVFTKIFTIFGECASA